MSERISRTAPDCATLPVEAQTLVARLDLALKSVIAVVLVGWAVKSLYVVLVPFVFAYFFAVLVHPVQAQVNRRVSPRLRWMGTAAAMSVFALAWVSMAGCLWWCGQLLAQRAPKYQDVFRDYGSRATAWLRDHHLAAMPLRTGDSDAGGLTLEWTESLLRPMWETLAMIVVVTFLLLLLLSEFHEWKRKSMEAFQGPRTRELATTVGAVSRQLRRYFYVRAGVSFCSAVIEGLWIWAMGVDFAFVWGVLFFVLNFVPNLGSIIAAIPPILFALVQHGLGGALLMAGGLLFIEQVIGNFLDPKIQGRALKISPVVVFLAIIFWSWAWGVAGAFLAVPMTIGIMIVCSHVRALKPIAIMLSRPGNDDVLGDGEHV